MRIAIIDLGTNTFNLLIAEWKPDYQPAILHRSKYACKIGKGGINNKVITDPAMARGLNALKEMQVIIKDYGVEKSYAFATSAFRSAENGEEFVQKIQQNFEIEVKVISGEKEAELIYLGTRNAVPMNHEKVAILDIGGGSNEIIIANGEQIFWKKSFPIGITRLLERFLPSDPIAKPEIKEIEQYLKEELQELFEANELHNVKTLVGSSGSFDTIRKVLLANGYPPYPEDATHFEIKLKDFFHLHQQFLASTLEERKAMPGMDMARVDLLVLASLFINFIIKEMGISKLYQSSYALKEGVLFELTESYYQQ